MQVTYLGDMVYSSDFLFALLILTIAIWLVLKFLFNFDSMNHALVFAILAMVMLPFIFTATQIWTSFFVVLILGGLAISQAYKWPIGTSILMCFIALIAASILLPAL